MKTIGDKAFYKCKALTKIKIPAKVTTIGANAFNGCSKLKTATLGKNVKTIGDKAFYKCISLTKISIPGKVTKIGKKAFNSCKKLKRVDITSKKIKSIGSGAFKNLSKGVDIRVPRSKLKAYVKMLKK